jgi:pyruvyl transferase EpsO
MIELSANCAAGALQALKQRLRSVLDLFDPASQIFYVDYPVHSNIGDLLINFGTEQFFLDCGIPIYRRYSAFDLPDTTRLKVSANATFLCHGGGNFGDIYPKHQGLRERLLEAFPKVRIVFLPQSLHYSSEQVQRASLQKIARHPNCHVLVRDRRSLDALRESRIAECSMMPDMAHQLWGTLKPAAAPQHGRAMRFFRQDREASPVPPQLRDAGAGGSVDWSDIVSTPHRVAAGGIYTLLKFAGHAMPARLNASLWYTARDPMIHDAVAYFSRFDRVTTNRLHAMLLALLLGRDVNAFDNSYGKLTRYIDAWLTPCAQLETAQETSD